MKVANALFPLLLLSIPLAGCAADAESVADEDDVEVASVEEELTIGPSNDGYFQVTRRDWRKCLEPICGGYFVRRVNQAKTRCANGTMQPECYVASIQLTDIGLSPREAADVRARLESGKVILKASTYKLRFAGWTLGVLKANEAWVGVTGSVPAGSFYRVADSGIRCITTPCPMTRASVLNGSAYDDLVDVHLESTALPADSASLARAQTELGTDEGILVAGGIGTPGCASHEFCGSFITASEFYLRVQRREGKPCGFWSTYHCNDGQFCNWAEKDICGAADAAGTCTYKPQACTMLYDPVCGCDGQTHGNACLAAAAGASVSSRGRCEDAK